jgi:hypothetical protein
VAAADPGVFDEEYGRPAGHLTLIDFRPHERSSLSSRRIAGLPIDGLDQDILHGVRIEAFLRPDLRGPFAAIEEPLVLLIDDAVPEGSATVGFVQELQAGPSVLQGGVQNLPFGLLAAWRLRLQLEQDPVRPRVTHKMNGPAHDPDEVLVMEDGRIAPPEIHLDRLSAGEDLHEVPLAPFETVVGRQEKTGMPGRPFKVRSGQDVTLGIGLG